MSSGIASDDSPDASALAEWHDAPLPNEFARRLGPLQRRQTPDGWRYGLRAEEVHRNGAGLMHGGAMAAFIDEVIGTIAREVVGRPHVTVQLGTVFLEPVRVGDFVELSCEIFKVTRSMTFVDAKLHVAGALVATASLILKAAARAGPGQA